MAAARSTSLESYVDGWRQRALRAEGERSAWQHGLRARLKAVVDLLVRDYGVRRIVLFGSLARDEARPGSDVDLLVDGLGLEHLVEASAQAGRILQDADVDLVPAQVARPEILIRAELEGQVLYWGGP